MNSGDRLSTEQFKVLTFVITNQVSDIKFVQDSPASGLRQLTCQFPVCKYTVNRPCQKNLLSGWNQQPRATVLDQLRHTAHASGNDRDACGPGLEDCERHAHATAGRGKDAHQS